MPTLIAAIANQQQKFNSGRIAYNLADRVQLEIQNTTVLVYSAGPFPNLLYTYDIKKPSTRKTVEKNGIISPEVSFHISRRKLQSG